MVTTAVEKIGFCKPFQKQNYHRTNVMNATPPQAFLKVIYNHVFL